MRGFTAHCVSFINVFFVLRSGWQPRWFVLENGVISYYDSEDDVGKGSKGSIKMSVCDIKGWTSQTEHSRYLKVNTSVTRCSHFVFQFIRQIQHVWS